MDELKIKLDGVIKEAVREYALPGLALGVKLGKQNQAVKNIFCYQGATGVSDLETGAKMESDAIFHMASVTKLFVGTAIMQLWERNILSLEERLTNIFPELEQVQPEFEEITIKHLLTHTSGLSNVENFGWDRPEIDESALQRYVLSDEIKKIKFQTSPQNAGFYYSDVGYELLGAVVERKTDISFESYIKKNIFDVLKMKDSSLLTFERSYELPEIKKSLAAYSSFDKNPEWIEKTLSLDTLNQVGMAIPHKKDEKGRTVRELNYPYNRSHAPSSTLTSNLSDMQSFADAHLAHLTGNTETGRLLKDETYETIWKVYATVPNNGEHIGLSWFIREQNGYLLYGHEGTDDGFRASFWICPQLDMSILVNSNITKAPVKRIAKKVFSLLCTNLEN